MPQSSHHENYRTVLTFGWFGGACLSMSAQKLAILADPIWTFYKVGIVGLAKNCSRPQHKKTKGTQKHTTTKMSHRLTLQRLCHLLPWKHPSWTQISAQHLTTSPCKARARGFGGAVVSSFVWGANAYPIKKYSNGHCIGLWWPPIDEDTQ